MSYLYGALGALFLGMAATIWFQHGEIVGLQGQVAQWPVTFSEERSAFQTEQGIARSAIKARQDDHSAAVADANASVTSCQARVAAARKSATAISTLLNEPPHASNPAAPGEPELLTADQLRAALGR